MNNSFIATQNVSLELEEPVDNTVILRQQETELLQIMEALEAVTKTPAWQTLQTKVFGGVLESLLRRREQEIVKKPLNGPMIHSLNGQIEWAEKYSNLSSLADIYKLKLTQVRKELNGKKSSSETGPTTS